MSVWGKLGAPDQIVSTENGIHCMYDLTRFGPDENDPDYDEFPEDDYPGDEEYPEEW